MASVTGPTETGYAIYEVSFSGTSGQSATLTTLVSSSVTVQDYKYSKGTTGDNLDVLGDDNQSSYSSGTGGDKFYASYGGESDETFAYYGLATIDGVSGFIAAVYPESGGSVKYYFFAKNSTLASGSTGTVHYDSGTTGYQWDLETASPVCFTAGTLVATPSGEVAVERLKPGDAVVTSGGQVQPVRWLGRQTVSRLFADPATVNPIRIRAGALGGGLPRRDLCVSSRHALLVDGVLVQAGALINGISILRETEIPRRFVYYHVELATHALILAEGTPAESFIDNVDREAFDNWEEHEALCGEAEPLVEMNLPRAVSARQVPMATRRRLATLAANLFGANEAAA